MMNAAYGRRILNDRESPATVAPHDSAARMTGERARAKISSTREIAQ